MRYPRVGVAVGQERTDTRPDRRSRCGHSSEARTLAPGVLDVNALQNWGLRGCLRPEWVPAVVSIFVISVGCPAAESPVQVPIAASYVASAHSARAKSLPRVLVSALAKVEGNSRIPILLPSALPGGVETIRHATVDKATPKEYQISLYYKVGVGDAGFAGMFFAKANPGYSPERLSNVHAIRLAHGIRGFFRAVSCGGSCASANLWWEQGRVLYQIQLVLPSHFSDSEQEDSIAKMADSAILAGPR